MLLILTSCMTMVSFLIVFGSILDFHLACEVLHHERIWFEAETIVHGVILVLIEHQSGRLTNSVDLLNFGRMFGLLVIKTDDRTHWFLRSRRLRIFLLLYLFLRDLVAEVGQKRHFRQEFGFIFLDDLA